MFNINLEGHSFLVAEIAPKMAADLAAGTVPSPTGLVMTEEPLLASTGAVSRSTLGRPRYRAAETVIDDFDVEVVAVHGHCGGGVVCTAA
ncbi:hypothetical protein [Actinoplanes auranticolor]|nr:hypothetical protein [Actinoplanes auranticolor]